MRCPLCLHTSIRSTVPTRFSAYAMWCQKPLNNLLTAVSRHATGTNHSEIIQSDSILELALWFGVASNKFDNPLCVQTKFVDGTWTPTAILLQDSEEHVKLSQTEPSNGQWLPCYKKMVVTCQSVVSTIKTLQFIQWKLELKEVVMVRMQCHGN